MPHGGHRRKLGLRVAYHDHVERLSRGKCEVVEVVHAGWFIEVFRGQKWVAIMNLRFRRERDALRGMQSLTAAGLDNFDAIRKADGMTVKQVACEHLQW